MIRFVVADDLTGAADSAVHFGAVGRVRITYPPAAAWSEDLGAGMVQVRDTETRSVPDFQAARAVGECCLAMVRSFGPSPKVFKKVDSTLRGAVGPELLAAGDALRRRVVLLAPSLPAQGRTVVRGRLLVDGEDRGPVMDGAEVVDARRLSSTGWLEGLRGKLVVADAASDEDLDLLAAAIEDRDDILPAGSAGLAAAIARRHWKLPPAAPPLPRPAVVVAVGTRQPGARGHLAAIRKGLPEVAVFDLLDEPEGDADALAVRLAHRTATELRALPPGSAIIATGGDTALAVCRELGAGALRPGGELLPGVVWNQLEGSDTMLVTKAGGFGQPDVLLAAVRLLLGNPA